MGEHNYRRDAFEAWLLPVGLFLVAPYMVLMTMSDATDLFVALLFLVLLLTPIAVVGYLLAPWAGRMVPTSKGPAFVLCAMAAVSPMAVPTLAGIFVDSWRFGLGVAAIWGLFALPASVIGALLFIGACERRQTDEI